MSRYRIALGRAVLAIKELTPIQEHTKTFKEVKDGHGRPIAYFIPQGSRVLNQTDRIILHTDTM